MDGQSLQPALSSTSFRFLFLTNYKNKQQSISSLDQIHNSLTPNSLAFNTTAERVKARSPSSSMADDPGDSYEKSLSFAGMAPRSGERLRAPPLDHCPLLHDTPFEFHRSVSPTPSPADVLFSNSQLVPNSFPIIKSSSYSSSRRRESLPSPRSTSSRSSSSSSTASGAIGEDRKKCLRESNAGRRSLDSGLAARKKVTFQENLPAPRHTRRAKNYSVTPEAWRSKKKVQEKQGGLFGSFMLVCRECHALEPSKHIADKIIAT